MTEMHAPEKNWAAGCRNQSPSDDAAVHVCEGHGRTRM